MFRFLKNVILLSLTALCFVAILLAWQFLGLHTNSFHPESQIALWMEHEWSTTASKDFTKLQTQIQNLPVQYLYFHVGPLNPDGSRPDDVDIPTKALAELKTQNLAWIGQIRSKIDLDNPTVRQEMIRSAQNLMAQGFDGVHIDIEPVRPDDQAFILFMEELRTALPTAFLSVAMDEWQPFFFHKIARSYWTRSQVRAVAKSADQLVVMVYDTDLQSPKVYQWWVEQQAVNLSKILPKGTELFIGIPSYEKGPSINPQVENVSTGITGYQRALQNLRTRHSVLKGIAVYPYWELSEEEWKILETLK